MNQDNVFSGPETTEKLMAGVNKVADAVKITLGAAGANGILEAFEQPGHLVTNDGISIAERIVLADPLENMGRNILLESISRANKQSGDGSTTTCVLTQTILKEGYAVRDQIAPNALKRSLEECLPLIEESIKSQTKDITVDSVGAVASISAEDEKIGALIQEIYQKIGKDGILYPDISKTFEDHYTLGSGVKIDGAGLVSPYMADIDDKTMVPVNVARIKDATIMVTKQKITNARRDLETIVGQLSGKSIRDLVIFCSDIEPTVIGDLVSTRFKSGFRTIIVKLPVIYQDEWFEDIALLTGATIIDPARGITFATMKYSHLGTCSFMADKNDTFLDGTKDVSEHIKTLEEGTDQEKIRAARLNTKTARLFVGAPTEAALSYKRLKVEDARNAAWQALHGGIVPGGGVTLRNIIPLLPDNIAGKILSKALAAPIGTICKNADFRDQEGNIWDGIFLEKKADGYAVVSSPEGLDAKTGQVVNMMDANIIDPANVVLNSIRNAVSVASTVLTARVVVTIPQAIKDASNKQQGL